MLPAPTSRPGGLRFRLFGFPVRIDPMFVVIMAILAAMSDQRLVISHIVVWIVVAAIGVLAHELGHAFVARTTGARPTIDLYGMGGVTTFLPPRPMGRFRSFAVSICGPLVGIAIGLGLLYGGPYDAFAPGSIYDYAVFVGVWVNLGWGVLNMLPILPLDGGQTLLAILPGSPPTRQRVAAAISVVTAVAAGVVAYLYGQPYMAVFMAWFVANNIAFLVSNPSQRPASARRRPAPQARQEPLRAVRDSRPAGTGAPSARHYDASPAGVLELQRALLWLLDHGESGKADHLLSSQPAEVAAAVDPAVHGLIAALTGFAGRGEQQVHQAMAQRPHDPVPAGAYLRLLVYRSDWNTVLEYLDGVGGAIVQPDVVRWACGVAKQQGNRNVEARLQALAHPTS